MEITNEKELYELIRKKELNEVKEIFCIYSIKSKQLNYFKTILLFYIRKKNRVDFFKFFIEKQQQQKEDQQTIDNIDLLFNAVEYNNFNAAQLVLNMALGLTVKMINQKILLNINVKKINLILKNYYLY